MHALLSPWLLRLSLTPFQDIQLIYINSNAQALILHQHCRPLAPPASPVFVASVPPATAHARCLGTHLVLWPCCPCCIHAQHQLAVPACSLQRASSHRQPRYAQVGAARHAPSQHDAAGVTSAAGCCLTTQPARCSSSNTSLSCLYHVTGVMWPAADRLFICSRSNDFGVCKWCCLYVPGNFLALPVPCVSTASPTPSTSCWC
jgi:hypothetical protein